MQDSDITVDMLRFAQAVAGRYSSDPETKSLAGESLLRACRTYDPERCPELLGWIGFVVKIDTMHWLRKVKVRKVVELAPAEWWEHRCCFDRCTEDVLTPLEWKLLTEKYELRWPLDVVARRNQLTVYTLKKLLAAAAAKLQEAAT